MRLQQTRNNLKSFSLITLLIGFSIVSIRFFGDSRWDLQTKGGVINWDVLGYYLYLPSTFIYKDVKKLSYTDSMRVKYNWPGDFYQAYDGPDSNKIFKYPAGTAVLYLPAFAMAHLRAKCSNYPTDGFSQPYQTAISIWGWLIAFIGLLFTRGVLLKYFSEPATAMVLLILILGTNYYQYTSFDFTSPHNYLFTLCALLLWLTISFYKNPGHLKAAAIGIICGLAALTRPTDLVFVLIPIFWGAAKGHEHWRWLWQHSPKLLLAAFATIAIGSIQLFYWKYVSGDWLVYSYEDQGFSFFSPHITNVLFSYRKGWLIYTPLMTFAVVGLYFLFKNYRKLFVPVTILFAIHFWIVASWDIWWYGGGWGQRAMIDIYPALALPMAAFLVFIFKNKFQTAVTTLVILAGIALNLFMIHQGNIDTEYTTGAYFKKVFLAKEVTEQDQLLKDTDEYFKGTPDSTVVIMKETFDQVGDTALLTREEAYSRPFATWVGPKQEYSQNLLLDAKQINESFTYIRCKASFYTPAKESSFWAYPQFIITFLKKGQPVKQKFIRVQRILPPKLWKDIYFDTKIPDKDFDTLQVHLFAAGCNGKTFMDDLEVIGLR